MLHPALLGPPVCKSHGSIWMDPCIEPLHDPILKNALKQSVHVVTPDTAHHHDPERTDDCSRFLTDFRCTSSPISSGQVIENPDVVVSGNQVDLNAFVTQSGQFTQEPGKSTGDHFPVFKPVIEYISQKP